MKVRTKEENAAYSRLLRARRRVAPVSPTTVAPVNIVSPGVAPPLPTVSPVAPCRVCLATEVLMEDLDDEVAALKLEVKKLVAQNALLESKLRAFTPHVEAKKSPYKFGPEWQRVKVA